MSRTFSLPQSHRTMRNFFECSETLFKRYLKLLKKDLKVESIAFQCHEHHLIGTSKGHAYERTYLCLAILYYLISTQTWEVTC